MRGRVRATGFFWALGLVVPFALGAMEDGDKVPRPVRAAQPSEAKSPEQTVVDPTTAKPVHDIVAQELETLPEGVAMEVTPETDPDIWQFFQECVAGADEWSPPRAAPVADLMGQESVRMVKTTGGVLGILERADGTVHLLALGDIAGNQNLGEGNALALHAVITEEDMELVWLDEDELVRFISTQPDGILDARDTIAVLDEPGDEAAEPSGVELTCNYQVQDFDDTSPGACAEIESACSADPRDKAIQQLVCCGFIPAVLTAIGCSSGYAFQCRVRCLVRLLLNNNPCHTCDCTIGRSGELNVCSIPWPGKKGCPYCPTDRTRWNRCPAANSY